jgi:hypothetical protein
MANPLPVILPTVIRKETAYHRTILHRAASSNDDLSVIVGTLKHGLMPPS